MRPEDSRRAALSDGLRELALRVDDNTVSRLLDYLDLLSKWNRTYNLSAVRDPGQMVSQHLLDCLAALPSLDLRLGGRSARILDVGSGAGLPGVAWALLRPQHDVWCVDSVAKKAAFVGQVAAELGIHNLRSEHARVEALHGPSFDVVASRAFASLNDFTRLSRRHLASDGCWLAMKGRIPNDEIAELSPDIEVFYVEPLTVPGLAAQRCLVWMRPAS